MNFQVHFSSIQLFGTQLLRRHGSVVLKNMLGESLRLCCWEGAKDASKTALKNSQFITCIVKAGVKKKKKGRESCGPITFSCRASHPIVFLITAHFVLRRQKNVIQLKGKWKHRLFIPLVSLRFPSSVQDHICSQDLVDQLLIRRKGLKVRAFLLPHFFLIRCT